jgi:hypothetical protein
MSTLLGFAKALSEKAEELRRSVKSLREFEELYAYATDFDSCLEHLINMTMKGTLVVKLTPSSICILDHKGREIGCIAFSAYETMADVFNKLTNMESSVKRVTEECISEWIRLNDRIRSLIQDIIQKYQDP